MRVHDEPVLLCEVVGDVALEAVDPLGADLDLVVAELLAEMAFFSSNIFSWN